MCGNIIYTEIQNKFDEYYNKRRSGIDKIRREENAVKCLKELNREKEIVDSWMKAICGI